LPALDARSQESMLESNKDHKKCDHHENAERAARDERRDS
jgi:hypothetical protein